MAQTPLSKFKNKLFELVNDFATWFPEDRTIAKYQFKLDKFYQANPRMVAEETVTAFKPFAHEILQGNVKYFLTATPEEILARVDSKHRDLIISEIDTKVDIVSDFLRSNWSKLTEEKQTIVKDRIKLIMMLASLAVKDEDMRKIINCYRDPSNQLTF